MKTVRRTQHGSCRAGTFSFSKQSTNFLAYVLCLLLLASTILSPSRAFAEAAQLQSTAASELMNEYEVGDWPNMQSVLQYLRDYDHSFFRVNGKFNADHAREYLHTSLICEEPRLVEREKQLRLQYARLYDEWHRTTAAAAQVDEEVGTISDIRVIGLLAASATLLVGAITLSSVAIAGVSAAAPTLGSGSALLLALGALSSKSAMDINMNRPRYDAVNVPQASIFAGTHSRLFTSKSESDERSQITDLLGSAGLEVKGFQEPVRVHRIAVDRFLQNQDDQLARAKSFAEEALKVRPVPLSESEANMRSGKVFDYVLLGHHSHAALDTYVAEETRRADLTAARTAMTGLALIDISMLCEYLREHDEVEVY